MWGKFCFISTLLLVICFVDILIELNYLYLSHIQLFIHITAKGKKKRKKDPSYSDEAVGFIIEFVMTELTSYVKRE